MSVSADPQTPQALPALPLRKNFLWTFAGNVTYQASQWGMLIVLAKLTSPEQVGLFALALAVAAPPMMFANLQLRAVQATDARRDHTFRDYLGLRLTTTSLGFLAILLVAFIAYRGPDAWLILLVATAKSIESVTDIIYGLMQQCERMDRIAQSLMIKGTLSLAGMGVGVWVTGGVVGGVIGMGVAWALVLIGYDLVSVRLMAPTQGLRPRWHLGTMKALALLALPLGGASLLMSVKTNVPRYLIEHLLGPGSLGIFAAMAYPVMAGTIVVSALGQSAAPRLAKLYTSGDGKGYLKLAARIMGVGGGLGLIGVILAVCCGKWFLRVAYGVEYSEQSTVFTWLVIAGGLGYIWAALCFALTAARYLRLQAATNAIILVTTVATCWWLIPIIGLLGAAWSAVLAAALQVSIGVTALLHASRRCSGEAT